PGPARLTDPLGTIRRGPPLLLRLGPTSPAQNPPPAARLVAPIGVPLRRLRVAGAVSPARILVASATPTRPALGNGLAHGTLAGHRRTSRRPSRRAARIRTAAGWRGGLRRRQRHGRRVARLRHERRLPGRLRRRLGSGDGLARRRAAPLAPSPRRLRRGKRVAPTRPVLRQSARGPPRGRLIVGWRGVPSRWRLRRPSRGLAAPARGPRGGRLRRAPARQVLWPSGRRRRHLIRTKIIGSDRDTLLLGGAQVSEPTQLLPADLRRGLPLGAAAPPPPHLAPNVPPLLGTLLGPIRTARSH